MSQPKPVPNPGGTPENDAAGGLDPTLQATGDYGDAPKANDPTLQATVNFTPSITPPGGDPTLEVTNLAFPRAHTGPEPDATIDQGPTLPGRPRYTGADADSSATLDAEGKTNQFSMSSDDGSARIVFNDLPFVKGYKLISELGRGGMGVVYKARQEKLDRLVALKMVLAGAHASADQLARFLIEAQAVAHLTHNHIVQIYDVGERDNLPFFSLEYVDGGSLQQTIGGKPQPVRYSAKTVQTLCEAMAFAHSENIIHRDLKPANVLMTAKGEPKITDFGLAKRLEGNSQQTRDGAIMGTPSYMAPEQAWGLTAEIGPLADQHALGAILYEMLTGRPPYQGATPLDTLDQVRNQEPVPPTRLQPKVPKDLETICLKALQKEAPKRYESAAAMAEDLERYLDGKPILARPVSAPERAYRWCRRNKAAAAAILVTAASLIAIAGGSIAAAVVLNGKNTQLTAANKAANDAKDLALVREAETRAVAEAALDQSGTMLEAQRYVTVLANMKLRDIPGTFEVRKEMFTVALKTLERGVKDLDRLRKVNAGSKLTDALTLRTLAGIHQNRGMLYAEMPSKAALVWPEFETMDRLAKQHYQEMPDDLEAIKNMASSKLTLADYTLALKSDTAAAEAFYKEAVKFREMWLEREPKNDIGKNGLANALGGLARIYLIEGRPRDAVDVYKKEFALRESIGPEIASETEFRREVSGLLQRMGENYENLKEFEAARNAYTESLQRRKAFLEKSPEHPESERDYALGLEARGKFFQMVSKDPKAAMKDYEEAVRIYRERYNRDPKNMTEIFTLSNGLYYLGVAAAEAKDLPVSDLAFQESLTLSQQLLGNEEPISDLNRSKYIQVMTRYGRCGNHQKASEIALKLVSNPPDDGYVLFQAACGYSLAAAAAERFKADDHVLAQGYKASALSALRMALAHNWCSPHEVESDPDLAAVRSDPGFPKVLEEFVKADTLRKEQREKAKNEKKS